MAGLLRKMEAPQRRQIAIAYQIDETAGTPALAIGSQDGALTDNGVGDYTITFDTPFNRAPIVMATCKESGRIVNTGTVSTTAAQILVFQADGSTAEDADVDVLVIGWYAEDEV